MGEQESWKTPLGWYNEQEDTKPPQSLGGEGGGDDPTHEVGLVGLVGWQES
jgi:hypothetical protein